MRLLLDTQLLIWLDTHPDKVSVAANAALLNENAELYLSSISTWEICLKVMRGTLTLFTTPEKFIAKCREYYDLKTLPFDEASAFVLMRLPKIHADPFDRMLICQALEHNLSIVTSDRLIQQYPVKTIW